MKKQFNDNMIVVLLIVCKYLFLKYEYHGIMKEIFIEDQVALACHRALNLQNQDPLSATCGCFDRRFWAWKLIDYPEATFQRLILPLCWYAQIEKNSLLQNKFHLAVYCGLKYALQIQHQDGSFDQAYPHEHSFGATAFLLHPLQVAFEYLLPTLDKEDQTLFENSLLRSAQFLCDHKEQHAFISNHLAGCALALLETGNYFNEPGFIERAEGLLGRILEKQSPEGWYLEYEGADAGYQTLCVDYLAQFYRINASVTLLESLERSATFLSFFAQPDGTFGGEYGSRRTAVYYPGGLALLADEIPAAAGLHLSMLKNIEKGATVRVTDIDVGNLAPLLSSTMLMHKAQIHLMEQPNPLPWQQDALEQEFPAAGFYVKGNKNYYSVLGASNGGVCKVWDKNQAALVYDDCGLLVHLKNGKYLTSQHTSSDFTFHCDGHQVDLTAPMIAFHPIQQSTGKFILLRLANVTLMRIPFLNELVKKGLAKLLVKPAYKKQLIRHVRIVYKDGQIVIEETLSGKAVNKINRISVASAFTAIHMASARYPLSTSGLGKETAINYRKEQGKITWKNMITMYAEGKE